MINNLQDLMIGVSEFKAKVNEIINNKLTKIIMKNNNPVSVVLPYEEYIALKEQAEEGKNIIGRLGQDITLDNGVQIMVTVNKEEEGFCIKNYIKMKTSGDYKLDFTQHHGTPSVEKTYTVDELISMMQKRRESKLKPIRYTGNEKGLMFVIEGKEWNLYNIDSDLDKLKNTFINCPTENSKGLSDYKYIAFTDGENVDQIDTVAVTYDNKFIIEPKISLHKYKPYVNMNDLNVMIFELSEYYKNLGYEIIVRD